MSYVFKRLEGNDINVTQFNAYKTHTLLNTDIGTLWQLYQGFFVSGAFTTGSETPYNNQYPRCVWHSMNKLFYAKNSQNTPVSTYPPTNAYQRRDLYDFVSVLSIPQSKYGQGIKPGSVTVTCDSFTTFQDDGFGNLCTVEYNSTLNEPFAAGVIKTKPLAEELEDGLVAAWNFAEASHTTFRETSSFANYGKYRYNTKGYGVATEFATDATWIKNALLLSASAYLEINSLTENFATADGMRDLNFRNEDDFTISFWVRLDSTDSTNTHTLITKNGLEHYANPGRQGFSAIDQKITLGKFPYSITYNCATNDLTFQRSDGNKTFTYTVNTTLNTDTYRLVALTKADNVFKFYVDSSGFATGTDTTVHGDVHNNSSVFIGKRGDGANRMHGGFDLLRIYNRALTSNEIINCLLPNPLNTQRVGNIFYDKGIITITNPVFRSAVSSSIIQLVFQSTQPINELEVSCTVSDSDFNSTQNNSVRDYSATKLGMTKDFVTGSNFTPYVTSVGLYNEAGELLIVGKLGQPVKKITNMDITFVLKLDY